jgi:integrase
MRKHFIWAVESCGVDPALTPHRCRHTTATRLALAGANIKRIQKFMGHKTVSVTMRYIKMVDEDRAEVAKILDPQCGETEQKGPSPSHLRLVKGEQ